MVLILIVFAFAFIYEVFFSKKPPKTQRVLAHTHKQFMDNFKRKSDVIKEFGLPDLEKKHENYIEWYYERGASLQKNTVRRFESDDHLSGGATTIKNIALARGHKSNLENETVREEIIEHKSFIKFVFDNETVIKWDSKGVDFTLYVNKSSSTLPQKTKQKKRNKKNR